MKKALIPITSLVIGILLGVFFSNYSYFKLDNTIELTDAAGLIITTGIGLYIAMTLQDRQSINRKEKDFIIDELHDLLKDINYISSCNEKGKFPFQETISFFKTTNLRRLSIANLIKISTFCNKIKMSEVRISFMELRTQVTGLSPTDTEIIITVAQKQIITKRIQRLTIALYTAILDTNKA